MTRDRRLVTDRARPVDKASIRNPSSSHYPLINKLVLLIKVGEGARAVDVWYPVSLASLASFQPSGKVNLCDFSWLKTTNR
jgi:hypothetical protein